MDTDEQVRPDDMAIVLIDWSPGMVPGNHIMKSRGTHGSQEDFLSVEPRLKLWISAYSMWGEVKGRQEWGS